MPGFSPSGSLPRVYLCSDELEDPRISGVGFRVLGLVGENPSFSSANIL